MFYVYNRSKEKVEKAEKKTCQRCKGHGSIFPADKGKECYLCKGRGTVIMSEYGWIRPLYTSMYKAVLY